MKSITVFTPTYNRAFCLPQLYNSLVAQTSRDFLWLIIDDGSTDTTRALVDSWIAEGKIEIQYIFQQNQGMHGAHNTAYEHVETPLNICIDSDDYMPSDAVEKILSKWSAEKSDAFAGIIGLDAFKDGSIVGTKIPDHLDHETLTGLYREHKVRGDKKLVLRTDVVKQFPRYPIFEHERFVPLGILYLMIDQKYTMLCSNDIYCIVEYLPDGSSHNILKQYVRNPQGFLHSRRIEMAFSNNISYIFTRAMHLISSSLFAKKYNIFEHNPHKLITLAALPFGLALHAYILLKNRS